MSVSDFPAPEKNTGRRSFARSQSEPFGGKGNSRIAKNSYGVISFSSSRPSYINWMTKK